MTDIKNFENKYSELVLVVKREIEMVEIGESKKSIQQLRTIINDMGKMNEARNTKQFMPSFPRFIVDSWDFNDSLGLELLKFYAAYKKFGACK